MEAPYATHAHTHAYANKVNESIYFASVIIARSIAGVAVDSGRRGGSLREANAEQPSVDRTCYI